MQPARPNLSLLPQGLEVTSSQRIASLWSNYGYIYRLYLASNPRSLILKSIHPPALSHPDESNLRKLLSYDIERWFYRHLASHLPASVKVASEYPLQHDAEHSLLLEDLAVAYPYPASGSLDKDATLCVLDWLAGFHSAFFRVHAREGAGLPLVPPPTRWKEGSGTAGVWERGTYWYLDTRREELEQTDKEEYGWLMPWVEKVNDALNREIRAYGTLVHGDVKGANIVFNCDPYRRRGAKSTSTETPLCCALYDLQYVGLGLPTLDLIYFLGTSVQSGLLRSVEDEYKLLRQYFLRFSDATSPASTDGPKYTFDKLLVHWDLAIVDWYRFMAGWGFWGNDHWVECRAKQIVARWNESGFPFDSCDEPTIP